MVRKVTFTSLLALVGLTVSVTAAPAPVVTARGTVVDPEIFAREKNRTLRRIGNVFKREKAGTNDKEYGGASSYGPGGLASITNPVVEGVVNPLTTGVGRGVAGAAAGTQQTADLLGDAADTLFHTLQGIAGNVEQGAGVAVANAASAVQSTVHERQHDDGPLGDLARILGGS